MSDEPGGVSSTATGSTPQWATKSRGVLDGVTALLVGFTLLVGALIGLWKAIPHKTATVTPEISMPRAILPQTTPAMPNVGWAFFGAQDANNKWFYNHFEIESTGNRPPRIGDTVISRSYINIRQGPIEDTGSGWNNQPVTGLSKTGDRFMVMRVVEVYPGFYWIELKTL